MERTLRDAEWQPFTGRQSRLSLREKVRGNFAERGDLCATAGGKERPENG